jgi:hypothetical protein
MSKVIQSFEKGTEQFLKAVKGVSKTDFYFINTEIRATQIIDPYVI